MAVRYFNPAKRHEWVAQRAATLPPHSRVLDVGAGIGRYRYLFSHCDYEAQDFGLEPTTIGNYTPLDYECDLTAIPVPDEAFDAVLCTEVLEHVPEPVKALQEIARILKPGGKLLLTAPLASFLHQEPYHYYGGYTPHWYNTFLPRFGLDIVSIEPNRGFFSFFGQESRRFSALIDPRRTRSTGLYWPLLTVLWAVSLPFCRLLFPLTAGLLDRMALEHSATVGYHVEACKAAEQSRSQLHSADHVNAEARSNKAATVVGMRER